MNSIFITDSGINKTTGGGIVSLNIVESLKDFGLSMIFCNQKFLDNKYQNIPCYSTNPVDWGYERYTPFFKDYLAFHLLPQDITFDLCVTYGCPMGLCAEELKKDGTKIVTDLAPHNVELSKEEHMKFVGSYDYPHLVGEVLWRVYSRHLRIADQVIVHSKSGANYIKQKAELKNDPVILPHGCYIPQEIPPYPEKIIPGYMGSISPDKGAFYFTNAFLFAYQNQPETQMVLGGRDAQNFMLEDQNLMKRFRITGSISDLNDFYKQISFGVFSSVTEGFNIPCLECFAYGRPAIITETIGMADYVEDGKEAFIVPSRDIRAIVDKMVYFQDNPAQIEVMGKNAYELAQKYSWEIIKKRYIEMFRSLL